MITKTFLEELKLSLKTKTATKQLERAARQLPGLAHVSNFDDLIRLIGRRPKTDVDSNRQNDIVLAVIACARERQSSIWNTALIAALFPQLCSLLRRTKSREIDDDDRQQMLLEIFLAVIDETPIDDVESQNVVSPSQILQKTRKRFVRRLRRIESRVRASVYADCDCYAAAAPRLDPNDAIELETAWNELSAAQQKDLEVYVESIGTDEPLAACLRRRFPEQMNWCFYEAYRRRLKKHLAAIKASATPQQHRSAS